MRIGGVWSDWGLTRYGMGVPLPDGSVGSNVAASSSQLVAGVAVPLFSWAIPQHHRHEWSHCKGAAWWLTNTELLGSAMILSTNHWRLPLLQGLSFGRATGGRMTWGCMDWEIGFRLDPWTACLRWLLRVLISRNAQQCKHRQWWSELATASLTARFMTTVVWVTFASSGTLLLTA